MSADYHFVTHWCVEGTAREVAEVLRDGTDLPRWWPSVYLEATEVRPGDDRGAGRVVDLYTKGWLPYTLRWRFTVTAPPSETGFALDADGDFVGRSVWTFRERPPFVDVEYDWRIRAQKPLLRRLTWLMRPVFAANHRWAMRKGEESLLLELARRRAPDAAARAGVPPPPGPTFRRAAGT